MTVDYGATQPDARKGRGGKGQKRGKGDTFFAQDTLSMPALRQRFGIAAATIAEHKDLLDLMKRIRTERITDPGLQQAMLQETSWWQRHTAKYLEIERARAQKPELWEATVERTARQIREQFAVEGSNIDEETSRKYATQFLYGGEWVDGAGWQNYDDAYFRSKMTAALDFSRTQTIGDVQVFDMQGKAEETADGLYKLARSYGMDTAMSNTAFTNWFKSSMRGLMDGSLQQQDVDDELIAQASSRFPGLSAQLQRGLDLRTAADPYLRAVADELDMDPESFDLNDDLVYSVLNNVDEQGNFQPLNLHQARTRARQDPRWQYTGKAKEEYTGMASQILRDFGFLG